MTDWLQAIGTVAAFAVTGAGLLWEARSRRLERRDGDKALARCVVITAIPDELLSNAYGSIQAVGGAAVTVTNYSREPITEVRIMFADSAAGAVRGDDFTASIGPGESHGFGWKFAKPLEYPDGDMQIPPSLLDMVKPVVEYRIVGGLWTRAGHLEPVRGRAGG